MTEHVTPLTAAAVALKVWLDTHHESRSVIGKGLGVTRQTLYRWQTGESRPTLPQRIAIAKAAGIPTHLWLTADEVRASRP
jgi:transcriptional regulator with XRE-family HTH domain